MNIPTNEINNSLGKLRRSTVVTTFGPGSVVDFLADGAPVSAIIAGLDEWDRSFPPAGLSNEQIVYEPRLQKKLNVSGFRLPPVIDENDWNIERSKDKRSLVAVRFPTWLQCPQCDSIAPYYMWKSEPGKAFRYCSSCTSKSPGKQKVYVIPVRFVMACEAGHLDEFPWHWWVEHRPECKYKEKKIFLQLRSKNPGLAGLILRCPECGASKSMEGIFNAQNLRRLKCRGLHPWLKNEGDECNLSLRVLQRGASNIYFPVSFSALSIPPWTDKVQAALGSYWSEIVDTKAEQRAQYIKFLAEIRLQSALDELHLSPEELANIIERRFDQYEDDSDIIQEEYQQFVSGVDTKPDEPGEFEIRNVKIPSSLRPYFNNIVRVVRLREVKALTGFTRINPPGDERDQSIIPLSIQKTKWLPAIETRGEGIFLAFNQKYLQEWESQEEILKRANKIRNSWLEEWTERDREGEPSPLITPRYLLVHTWAHALMRQLTLECGYSSASLRERLYVSENDDPMAGLLIYTATSDSDGTLGGLQRQGKPENISRTVHAAVKAMEWCSSDPLCIEGMVASPENHSLAACHSCCLAPETSCEQFNRFLDRATLIGLPNNPEIGYFSSILQEK